MAQTHEQRKQYWRDYYARHKERAAALAKIYRRENAAAIKVRSRAKYLRNREKTLAEQKAKRDASPEINKARCKRYHRENLAAIKAQRKAFYYANRERLLAEQKAHRKAGRINENLPRKLQLQRERRKANPEKYRKRDRIRCVTNLSYRLSRSLSTRVRCALKKGGTKSAKTRQLIGCSIEQLKSHLQARFSEGMQWNNYGKWHIDHIIPCAAFDLTKPLQQRICFNWSNLQPMWATDNLRKNNKVSFGQTALPLTKEEDS